VFTHAHDRRVVFSCFAPDVCIALNLKQPRYPVCFLTEGGKSAETYTDLRCSSLGAALAFAQSNGLSGVVTDSELLFKDADFKDTEDVARMVGKDFVQECRNAGLMLWTWVSWAPPELTEDTTKRATQTATWARSNCSAIGAAERLFAIISTRSPKSAHQPRFYPPLRRGSAHPRKVQKMWHHLHLRSMFLCIYPFPLYVLS